MAVVVQPKILGKTMKRILHTMEVYPALYQKQVSLQLVVSNV